MITAKITTEENYYLASIEDETATSATFAPTIQTLRAKVLEIAQLHLDDETLTLSSVHFDTSALSDALQKAFELQEERLRVEALASALHERTKNMIMQLHERGFSDRDTAGALGVSRSYVHKVSKLAS